MIHYKHIVCIILLVVAPRVLHGQISDSLRQAVLGDHRLTLQWLDNQNRG